MTATLYVAENGDKFLAKNAEELVIALHGASWTKAKSHAEWMAQTAQRAKLQTGRPVRHANAVEFVEDMLACGLLRQEKAQPMRVGAGGEDE